MNWYRNSGNKLIKSASKLDTLLADPSFAPATNQHDIYQDFFDVQKYVMDSYSLRTSISKTKNHIKVTTTISHSMIGGLAFYMYWSYPLTEGKEALKTYDEINKIIKEVTTEMIEDGSPTAILYPMLREKWHKIDPEHEAKSNVPCVNYANRMLVEPDWRKSLYGTRYPNYDEKSYGE